jgi:uncharacterized protein YciI
MNPQRDAKGGRNSPVFGVEWLTNSMVLGKEFRLSQGTTTFYAVLRERGENWDASLPMRQQQHWDDHAAFMDALADEGYIILGGPLGDGEEKFLHIFVAESEQAVAARLADDPWTPLQMLRTASIERWEILLSGRR